MVDIVLRAVGGSDITLDPVETPAPAAPVTLYLYPIVAPATAALPVITLDAVAGTDLLLRGTSPAPASAPLTDIILRSTGAPDTPPVGQANALAGAAVAGAIGAAALDVVSGIALAGAAVAGAAGDAGLRVGVDLAAAALAGAVAEGALDHGIELTAEAVAKAAADAQLTVEGDPPPPPEGWVAGGSARWIPWHRPKPDAAIIRRHRRRDDDVIAALTH